MKRDQLPELQLVTTPQHVLLSTGDNLYPTHTHIIRGVDISSACNASGNILANKLLSVRSTCPTLEFVYCTVKKRKPLEGKEFLHARS